MQTETTEPGVHVGLTLDESEMHSRRRGIPASLLTPLIGCVVLIARRDARNGAGGGMVRGRLVAIATDGAYWHRPPSLVIVANMYAKTPGTNRIGPVPAPHRAGLVPIDHVVQLTVEEMPS